MENHLQISSPMAMAETTRRIKEPLKGNQNSEKKSVLEAENSPSVRALRNLFSCRYHREIEDRRKKSRRAQIGCSGSLCSLRDNPEANNTTTTTAAAAAEARVSTSGGKAQPLKEINGVVPTSSSNSSSTLTASSSSSSSSASSLGGLRRGMHLRRLSGCYECHHMAIDPASGVSRLPSLRSTVFPCPDCGEMFVKAESMELHQSIRHAVSELGPEDTSRNIVEIIFQSSWLKKHAPVCKIERILKVHNSKKTAARFEDYRESVKSKASKLPKKHPRCVADGNELLRFYCTSFKCSLGQNGCSNLCDSIPHCKACSIIRDGIKVDEHRRIQTMATSGRAHDAVKVRSESEKMAMLVCRVIAGRVKKSQDASEDQFDSVAGTTGLYSNLDELYVFNPKSVLPCFLVIYTEI